MKKYFVFAAAALAALTSCSKVEPEDLNGPEIGFQVANYVTQTKATGAEYTYLNFKTYAFYYTAPTETAQPFMKDETITKQGEGAAQAWKPSRAYFWPKSGAINFISYYTTAGLSATISGDYAATISGTVAKDSEALLADEAYQYSKNVNEITTTGTDYTGVPTLFRHTLAKLNFDFKAGKVEEADGPDHKTSWDITISSVTLTGFKSKGSAAFTADKTSKSAASLIEWTKPTGSVWTPAADATLTTIPDTEFGKVTTAFTSTTQAERLLKNYVVMPQELSDDVKMTVTYKIVTKYDGDPYAEETITTDPIKLNTFETATDVRLSSWQMNKNIIYTVTIWPNDNTITFDPGVVDYDADIKAGTDINKPGQSN